MYHGIWMPGGLSTGNPVSCPAMSSDLRGSPHIYGTFGLDFLSSFCIPSHFVRNRNPQSSLDPRSAPTSAYANTNNQWQFWLSNFWNYCPLLHCGNTLNMLSWCGPTLHESGRDAKPTALCYDHKIQGQCKMSTTKKDNCTIEIDAKNESEQLSSQP